MRLHHLFEELPPPPQDDMNNMNQPPQDPGMGGMDGGMGGGMGAPPPVNQGGMGGQPQMDPMMAGGPDTGPDGQPILPDNGVDTEEVLSGLEDHPFMEYEYPDDSFEPTNLAGLDRAQLVQVEDEVTKNILRIENEDRVGQYQNTELQFYKDAKDFIERLKTRIGDLADEDDDVEEADAPDGDNVEDDDDVPDEFSPTAKRDAAKQPATDDRPPTDKPLKQQAKPAMGEAAKRPATPFDEKARIVSRRLL